MRFKHWIEVIDLEFKYIFTGKQVICGVWVNVWLNDDINSLHFKDQYSLIYTSKGVI